MKWKDASERGQALLKGVSRGLVPASEEGVELAYLDWGGDGEVVTMCHANGFCAASLALVASQLRDTYRVIAFDVRGHGDSTAVSAEDPEITYAWPRLAADYQAALSHRLGEIGRDRVRYALGHSFGGVLTLGAAAAMPGCIQEILLLDPVILPAPVPGETDPYARDNPMVAIARRRRRVFPGYEAAHEYLAIRELFDQFRPEALALYVLEGFAETGTGEIQLKCDPRVEAAVFGGARSIDPFALAPRVEARTTILHASRGNFSRAVYDELAVRMPNAKVVSVEGGHLFPMEEPGMVLEEIRG